MNKKSLSVVMAGAMLATSVAPVMAAEEKTLSVSDLAVYAESIKAEMEKNRIEATKYNTIFAKSGKYVSDDVVDVANSHLSAVGVKIGNNKIYNPDDVVAAIKAVNPGEKIEILKYETTPFHGLLIPGSKIESLGTEELDKYTESDFKDADALKSSLVNTFIKDVEVSSDKKSATVTLFALDENEKNKTLTINVGDARIENTLPMSGDNLLPVGDTDSIQKCDNFMRTQNWVKSQVKANAESVTETLTVVADEDATVENLKVSDLYDGTILTTRGTEILNDLKNDNGKKLVVFDKNNLSAITEDNNNGTYSFVVKYYAKGYNDPDNNKAIKTIKVISSNKKETQLLYKILKEGKYSVGIVGGANRYATAVNVAKQQGAVVNNTTNKNIVLVNGDALVDGLSAAPLAATINGTSNAAAPVLLSKADSLPKETKDYLDKLTESLSSKQKKEVVVTLVGGESVLTSSLENELTSMGFKVDRLGGDNREETSLEVAEVVVKGAATGKEVFVVGADGEADAMAISAVAAREKTPIIVAKAGGISKDALKFIGKQGDNDAIIIGGTSVFSKEDEEKINETKTDSATAEARRIAGKNRTETNAKILEAYYVTNGIGTGNPVVLAKDGMTNGKYELVDALTAANLGGPIVLAKDTLSKSQESALLKAHKKSNSDLLIQVGEGLNSDVIKSVSKLLKLVNKDS